MSGEMMDAADNDAPIFCLRIELKPIDAASNSDECASDNVDGFELAAGSDE